MTRTQPTPLGALARGLLAGAAGTAVMTAAQALPSKLSSSSGGEEAQDQGGRDSAQDPWEEAPAPAKVARRILEGVFGREVPADRIPLITQVMHWSYGTAWGAVYGLVQSSVRAPAVRHGAVFGTGVWAMEYVELMPMGLSGPPWRYPAKDVATEVGYHLAYGAGTAGAFGVLSRP